MNSFKDLRFTLHFMKVLQTLSFTEEPPRIKSISVSPDGTRFAVSTITGEIRIYSLSDFSFILSATHEGEKPIRSIKWMKTRNAIVYGCDDYSVGIFDINNRSFTSIYKDQDYVRSVDLDDNECFIFAACDSGNVVQIDLNDSSKAKIVSKHPHYAMSVLYTPTQIVSTGLDEQLIIQSDQYPSPKILELPHQGIGLAYDQNNDAYFVASEDGSLFKVNVVQGIIEQSLDSHSSTVTCVDTNRVIVSGSVDEKIFF